MLGNSTEINFIWHKHTIHVAKDVAGLYIPSEVDAYVCCVECVESGNNNRAIFTLIAIRDGWWQLECDSEDMGVISWPGNHLNSDLAMVAAQSLIFQLMHSG